MRHPRPCRSPASRAASLSQEKSGDGSREHPLVSNLNRKNVSFAAILVKYHHDLHYSVAVERAWVTPSSRLPRSPRMTKSNLHKIAIFLSSLAVLSGELWVLTRRMHAAAVALAGVAT